ncbi:N-acetylmuramoyl-L-alanine amidase [Romeria aff. gracilis LEGE 07310]|uniref:N-acetylmuramoyl-L-alanine amidase n=2 Tax=Vasconcelosia TaxID=3366328 RepID=A0A8J7DAT8_9CYAN|nr:N-acetylmuramoyl-L-alanine amidase [Romeria aff. gracilis LEGE 07310]
MLFTAQVVTTDEWEAEPSGPFSRTVPRFVVIHHTDNNNPPNDPSRGTIEGAKRLAKNIQIFHKRSRGWSDSGHNFLNTTGGFILEGRHGSLNAVKQGFCVLSAHALQDSLKLAGGNQSPGIENEGNFMTFEMGQAQWNSLVELCASLCESCAISPKNIRGHREFSNTDCPGDWLFKQLPRLRKAVADKLEMHIDLHELENNVAGQTLKVGSTGPEVIKLQKRLSERNFNPGPIDGLFGDGTRSAVILFQRSVGLEEDGIAGPQALRSLDLI